MPALIALIIGGIVTIWLFVTFISIIIVAGLCIIWGGGGGIVGILISSVTINKLYNTKKGEKTFVAKTIDSKIYIETYYPNAAIDTDWILLNGTYFIVVCSVLSGIFGGFLPIYQNLLAPSEGDAFEGTTRIVALLFGAPIGIVGTIAGSYYFGNLALTKMLHQLVSKSENLNNSRFKAAEGGLDKILKTKNEMETRFLDYGLTWQFTPSLLLHESYHSQKSETENAIRSLLQKDQLHFDQLVIDTNIFFSSLEQAHEAYHNADRALDSSPSTSLRSRLDDAWIGLNPDMLENLIERASFEEITDILVDLKNECDLIANQANLGVGDKTTSSARFNGTPSNRAEALSVLGLPNGVTIDQIKAIRKVHLMSFHPDKAGEDEIEHVKRVNAAWDILKTGRG